MKNPTLFTKLARFYVSNRFYIAVVGVMAMLFFFAFWPQVSLLSGVAGVALIAHLLVVAYLEAF